MTTAEATKPLLDNQPNPAEIASDWLRRFNDVVLSGNAGTLRDLLVEDSWWRDFVALQPDIRTSRGVQKIIDFFGPLLTSEGVESISLSDVVTPILDPATQIVTASFTFDTSIAHVAGVIRLMPDPDGGWKAWTVFTMLDDLIGHEEERTTLLGATSQKGLISRTEESWHERRARETEEACDHPDVLVVGAGHAGLNVAARTRRLGLKTLLCEKTARVGDQWRSRYHNLSLHDTKYYGQLSYMPYPDNWPVFVPKELVADWFETYAWVQELNVWTSTRVVSAKFDEADQRWTVVIDRNGEEHVVKPSHVVFGSGSFAEGVVPELPGREDFKGLVVHSGQHIGGPDLRGKNVVVVGTASSAMDVAQDAYENGATVTMVQRGPTYVVSIEHGIPGIFGIYNESSPPADKLDLLAVSLPLSLTIESMSPLVDSLAEKDKELLEGLERRGFRLTKGENNGGMAEISLKRGGGIYIEKGACQMIIDGKIALQQGEVSSYTADGVVYSDGTSAPADIVVFATGYPNMREHVRNVVGDEVADSLSEVWGLDEEGEIRGIFRPSGHPNLWYSAGAFYNTRYGSRLIARQIKASIEGIR
ncbi:flavin-containing monooxygenase [Rhodococcus opacus]|jgi:putative flavoprotein involved in K+ transport|uniref:flavin-containing monooxygenase n=1 Tax=Rhodococcus opacus TaxID=37919 RepID=UPI002474CFFA|nr:NAD(P)/FAD-dependent oxidoreductase [Rhodococcus opacus]MDH6293404.1 hypothetical protein [Rhodococcus opacus]